MQQLPKIYNVQSITEVNGIDEAIANRQGKRQIIEVVTYNDGTGTDKTVTYNLGVLTGYVGKSDGETVVEYINGNKKYWTSAAGLVVGEDVSKKYLSKAQSEADLLITNNKNIYEDLLLSAEFIKRLEAKGYNCNKYREEVKQLYSRFDNRQNYLISYSGSNKYATPQLLSNALQNIINGEAIGIAITTTIIITVVVSVLFASAGWYIFYTYGAEARSDCRKSKELNKILANVDPDVKEQLYNYIDKYADSYYKKAVARTKASYLFDNAKTIIIAGAVGYLVYKYLNKN